MTEANLTTFSGLFSTINTRQSWPTVLPFTAL